ncbi:MAG: choice-of-anchor J domain-containing protein [Crocinitomicaceae bacterium]|nr:choice-of-anchor J domain-containing protein [Crocinitomicaceae bacterium]
MRNLAALFLLGSVFLNNSFGQNTIFSESFTTGVPTTWYMENQDNLTPVVDTFDQAWISFVTSDDTCVASTSYYNPAGQSSDYLMTPRITLNAYSKLVWSARSYDASFPDDYIVLVSTTDSLSSSFTDTIFVQESESYLWQKRSVQLDIEGYASEDVFIAFKNITTDGYFLLLDDVIVLSSNFASLEDYEASSISLYPNPTAEFIQIQNLPENAEVTCFSAQGEIMFSGNSSSWNVSQLASGVYYIKITSDKGTEVLPFIRE